MEQIHMYFDTFAAYVFLIPLLIQGIKRIFNAEGPVAIILSWTISLIVAIAAWYADLGIFMNMNIVQSLIVGAVASLTANAAHWLGITEQTIEVIEFILVYLKVLPTPTKPPIEDNE